MAVTSSDIICIWIRDLSRCLDY